MTRLVRKDGAGRLAESADEGQKQFMSNFNNSNHNLTVESKLENDLDELTKLTLGLSPDGIILLHLDSLIVQMVNEAVLNILDREIDSLIGFPFPFPLIGDEPHEMCISRNGHDPLYVSIRKRSFCWKNIEYLILSMRDVTARVRLREQLRSDSLLDDLTGLHNRRGFISLGEQAIRLAQRDKQGLLMIFIDLDGMKAINDDFGHQNGDAALEDVAKLLRKTFRKADIVARLGGDEFAVIAQGRSQNDEAHILRRLLENLNANNEISERPFQLSISIGFSHYTADLDCSLDDLIERADAAMYEEKKSRRNSRRHTPTSNPNL